MLLIKAYSDPLLHLNIKLCKKKQNKDNKSSLRLHSTQLLRKKYHAMAATLGALLRSWARFRDGDSVGSEIMTVAGACDKRAR